MASRSRSPPTPLERHSLPAKSVATAGVELVDDGGGLRAVDAATGDPIPSHESFWFAWSQFHPTTELWEP